MALTMRNWFLASELSILLARLLSPTASSWAGSTTRGAEMLIALLGAGTCLGIGVNY